MTLITRGIAPLLVGQFFCISLLLTTSPARAEQDIQQLFQLGVEDFTNGRSEQALAAFEAVYAARQIPGVLYNIAMCHRALDRVAGDSSYAWLVRFNDGSVNYDVKSLTYYVRCVRGGP